MPSRAKVPMISLALLASAFALTDATAQSPRSRPAPGGDARSPGDRPPPPPGGARFGGGLPTRPGPEDLGPLKPGEGDELMTFARENVPNIHRNLTRARDRNPGEFRTALREAAPRLRQLRRMFQERPDVARKFVRHIENGEAIRRAARAYVASSANPNARARAENDIRRRIADNLAIERELLADRAEELDDKRTALVEREFNRVTAKDADLAPEPPAVRDAVRRFLASDDDDGRDLAADALRAAIGRQLDDEIQRCRNRAALLKRGSEREVDNRTRRLIEDFERRAEGDRPINARPGDRGRGRPAPDGADDAADDENP